MGEKFLGTYSLNSACTNWVTNTVVNRTYVVRYENSIRDELHLVLEPQPEMPIRLVCTMTSSTEFEIEPQTNLDYLLQGSGKLTAGTSPKEVTILLLIDEPGEDPRRCDFVLTEVI